MRRAVACAICRSASSTCFKGDPSRARVDAARMMLEGSDGLPKAAALDSVSGRSTGGGSSSARISVWRRSSIGPVSGGRNPLRSRKAPATSRIFYGLTLPHQGCRDRFAGSCQKRRGAVQIRRIVFVAGGRPPLQNTDKPIRPFAPEKRSMHPPRPPFTEARSKKFDSRKTPGNRWDFRPWRRPPISIGCLRFS
jgi:hypothetical protein